MNRRDFLTAISGGVAAMLAGCDRAVTRASRPPKIALVMKSLANEFFVTMEAGAREHQRQNADRYRLLVNGIANERDLAEQVAIIDQMIVSGADALVIAPADSKAVVPAVVRAQRAGLFVVNIDSRLDRAVLGQYAARIPFVGPDNRAGAAKVGAVLAQQLKPGDQIAVLEGVTTADNSIERRNGLLDAARGAGLKVVTVQSGEWDQTRADALTSAILISYPELKAVMCANDSMALGAAAAVGRSGRGREVKVTGFDNIRAIRPLLVSGAVTATADQHGDQLAVFGIDYALQALAGGKDFPDRTTPVDLIDGATLAGRG
jgi:ribose transport system substrate-binding protein